MTQKGVWKLAIVCLSVLVCVLAVFFTGGNQDKEQEDDLQSLTVSSAQTKTLIKVYVSGAVKNPGIYEVNKGCRALEAINQAGGMTAVANRDKVNLAKICKDGTQINVPKLSAKQLKELFTLGQSEAGLTQDGVQRSSAGTEGRLIAGAGLGENSGDNGAAITGSAGAKGLSKVNLNTATAEELTNLPGVGAATAQKIIAYRQQHAFNSSDEIMKVPGIGKAKYEKMKNYLTL